MKLKRVPEDFRVEELPVVQPGREGPYTFYRLEKRGIGTPEAIEAIRRHWNLSAGQIGYGGLKDKHAWTTQYMTILGGPDRILAQPNLTLTPLGRVPRAYGPTHFRGNHFAIVLRDLGPEARAAAEAAVAEVTREGLPNYFDDQRFGSLGRADKFIAEAWLKGDYERALFLAIAEPNPSDRPGEREAKEVLRQHWGCWAEAKARLERSHARSLVSYLTDHPTDFRGAFARLRRDLRSIYFSAFQSHLWNELLGRLIEHLTRPDQRIPVEFRAARLPLYRRLDDDQIAQLSAARIPLPSSRNAPPVGPLGEAARAMLEARGLTWESLRVRHLKDVFFSKGYRPAVFFAAGLTARAEPDELYPSREKLTLNFELPKGAYATLIVKRLTIGA